MHVDDLFAHVRLAATQFSPDGQALVFTRTRAALTAPAEAQSSFVGAQILSDVWLQDAPWRPPRNLTNGQIDGSGAWEPSWSPDGKRLAFLSTRGGGVSLWIWERASGRTRRVRTPGVKYFSLRLDGTYRWLDARRVLCFVEVGGGGARLETSEGASARLANEAWGRAARGEVTASVLKSTEFRPQPLGLWLVDVVADSGHSVGTTVETFQRPFRSSWVSPDGQALAMIRPIALAYNIASSARMGIPAPIEVRSLDGAPVVFKQPLPENIHAMTLKWSPDGKELAFFANGPGLIDPVLLYGASAAAAMPMDTVYTRGNPAKLYRVNVLERTVAPWGTGDIDLGQLGSPEFYWTAGGEIVVSAPHRIYGLASGPPPPRGAPWGWREMTALPVRPGAPLYWWVIDRTGRTRKLVPQGTTIPASLQSVDGGRALVGIRDGDVWSIDPEVGAVTNVSADYAPRILGIARTVKDLFSRTQLVVRAEVEGPPHTGPVMTQATHALQYAAIELSTHTIRSIQTPTATASLVDYAPATQDGVHIVDDLSGTTMWRTTTTRPPEVVAQANGHVREIEPVSCRTISYNSLDGEPLYGSLCLPFGYVAGRQYPLVVDVYYGFSVSSGMPLLEHNKGNVFTSAGYAFLRPSIPERLPNTIPEEGESHLMAIGGILPAVESAISLGIADPKRLFISGMSRGGFTVLATIGQTTRFKAAVSEAYADLARQAVFDHSYDTRYSDTDQMQFIVPNGSSKRNRPTDVPWWRDGDLFRRNHPFNYIDRVQTPVMLIHGDLDPIPFDASEDYFFALVSMRKPAEFVRYWGEGHGNKIPANIRDMYQRILAWFDRWGDISRDKDGELRFSGNRVRSREGAPPLTPEDFARVGPAAPSITSTRVQR